LVTKANAVEWRTTSTMWLHHQHNRSTHGTAIATVTSLSPSLQHKTSEAMDSLCQIELNQKLSRKFKEWCKFSSHIKVITCKKKLHKTGPACTWTHWSDSLKYFNKFIILEASHWDKNMFHRFPYNKTNQMH
jgi:hypothetical protein